MAEQIKASGFFQFKMNVGKDFLGSYYLYEIILSSCFNCFHSCEAVMSDKYSFNTKLMHLIVEEKKEIEYVTSSLFPRKTVEQNNYFLILENLICWFMILVFAWKICSNNAVIILS